MLDSVGLPQRWHDMVAGLSPRTDDPPSAIGLHGVKDLTEALGMPFVPREYDDDDYWPANHGVQLGDHRLVLRIHSRDGGGPTHRLIFCIELHPGNRGSYDSSRIETLVARLQPDAPVPEPAWYETYTDAERGIAWFITLGRDLIDTNLEHPAEQS
jgi:hypothetical protein